MIRGQAKSPGWIGRRGSVDPSAHSANGGRDDVEAIGVHWNAQRRVPAVCAKRCAYGAMMWEGRSELQGSVYFLLLRALLRLAGELHARIFE